MEIPKSKFDLMVTDIEKNQHLNDEFSLVIPVVRVDNEVIAESVVDIPKLRTYFRNKFSQ